MKGKALQQAGAAWDVGPHGKCSLVRRPYHAGHHTQKNDDLLSGATILHHPADDKRRSPLVCAGS